MPAPLFSALSAGGPSENRTGHLFGRLRLPGSWIAWLVLLVSLALTVGGWNAARKNAKEAARFQFAARSDDVMTDIRQRMQVYEYVLRGGAALFAASENVSRDEWHAYVSGLQIDRHLPGIQGVGFARHVAAGGEMRHVGQVRADGFPDYAIIPGGPRSEYTPIVYLEPFSGRNLRAFGFDMFSEPLRRAAIERARDTGEVAVSAKVKLVQETDSDVQSGVLMYLPVYRNGLPHGTIAERRAALLGYVYSPFRMDDLMAGIAGKGIHDLDIRIYDGEQALPSSLMYQSPGEEDAAAEVKPAFSSSVPVSVGGREWTVQIASSPSFDVEAGRKSPALILAMGGLISLLLFYIARGQERSRRHAASLAKGMTQAYMESELRLQALLGQTPAVLWALGDDLRFTLIQGAGLEAIGLKPGQLVGMPLQEYLGTDAVRHPVTVAARDALRGGERELDMDLNGAWFRTSVKPLKDARGRIVGVIGISFDISALRRLQVEADRLGRFYRLLSRVNGAIVRARDRDELFRYICQAAVDSELFRFAWIGLLEGRVVVPMAYAGVEEGYLEKLNIRIDDERTGKGPTATALRTETEVVCQDIEQDPRMLPWRDEALARGYRALGAFPICEGGIVTGSVNAYAVDGNFFTPDIVLLMRELAADVSFALDAFAEKRLRTQMENRLKQLNAELELRVEERTHQLEVANKELEAFSYSVSHDLRAPLRSIDGFSQILLKKYQGQLDEAGNDYLQRVRRASQRMGMLIDDLLQLSRVTRSSLKREHIDLSGIAASVAEELRKTEPARRVEFDLQQGLFAEADPGLLRVVMDNLLGNAWKFTGKKTDARIEFGLCDRDGENAFFVRDNGDGFNMNYVHKLFGAFQRLHGASEFEGTGIGLATVRRIIHRHHGRVWAEGKEGQGATFYFTLPETGHEA